MKTLALFLAISALAVAAVSPVRAEEKLVELLYNLDRGWFDHDPDATTKALGALLAVSNAEIPASSSCSSDPPRTVKDLLVVHLSLMYPGGNYVIKGNCHKSGRCSVVIERAAGEDASSVFIAFDKIQGEASVPTLQCLMIP
ncbi:MAG: hypothetical protein FWH15_09780 [Betaproteobacteria bacterium]|nr:hypothetical protein [Betaproteobacteria bacterium]